jgi:DNA-directed RNA polymerase subunit M/transcription elongation factor TFIIS
MPLFCKTCDNLLSVIATSSEFYFKCIKCQTIYDPDNYDTLRHENIKGTNLIIYKTILQNAGRDPVNPKVKKDCTTCRNNIVRQVRLGEDMRLINICTKCDKQWIEGLEKKIVD